MQCAHTLGLSLVFVNIALRTKAMKGTLCRGAFGGVGGSNNTLWEVQAGLCNAMVSGFLEEKKAHPKHGSAKWCARDIPSSATSCDQSLLTDGFAISRVGCGGREVEVGSHGLPLCLLGSAFNVIPSEIPESVNLPSNCCLKYHERVLPRKLVVGYRKALNCYLPAIM